MMRANKSGGWNFESPSCYHFKQIILNHNKLFRVLKLENNYAILLYMLPIFLALNYNTLKTIQ